MSDPVTTILHAIKGLFSGLTSLFARNGTGTSIRDPKRISTAEKFPNFVVVPINIPAIRQGTASDPDDLERTSTEIATRIKDALSKHYKNSGDFNIVELYALSSVVMEFTRFFNTPEALEGFQRICAEQVWPAGSDGRKVHFFKRPLRFDPVCATRLGDSLLVRPVGIGGETVSSDPGLHKGESYQFLVGEILVRNARGVQVARSPLRVWRQNADEHSYSLHLDFDVLSKAFEGKHHMMPLGITFNCTTIIEGGARRIEDVGMSVEEAKKWSSFLGGFTQYFIYTGSGRRVMENNVNILGDRLIPIDLLDAPETVDSKTNTKVTRQLAIHANAKDGKSARYIFRFFNRANKFDPKSNYLSLTGQLIRAGRAESVFTQPSLTLKAEEVFTIAEKPGSIGTFTVTSKDKRLTHQGTAMRTDVAPKQSIDVQFGDEISYVPTIPTPGDVGEFVFRISPTSGVPQHVLAAQQYSCLIEINPGRESRTSQLVSDNYELGGGTFFPQESGVGKRAAVFERPYTQIILKAGEREGVWVVDRENQQHVDGLRVNEAGFSVELNGRYEIYIDRFRLELNLSTTPLTY